MFQITPGMLQSWAAMNEPKASAADVALLQSLAGGPLSAAYVEFITRYGFVVFGRDPERRWLFTYVVDQGGQREVRQRGISYLYEPDKVAKIHRFMTTTDDPDDESRPQLPEGYLPIGSDSGHGRILLDVRANPGHVLYQPETDWRWGTEDNTWLGRVADNFYDFVNGLRPDPL
jgi:hypothetical protein